MYRSHFCHIYISVTVAVPKQSTCHARTNDPFLHILCVAPPTPMNAAGCHGAPRSFPDVQFPPIQHGVRKVRLRLMLHTSSKVSPLLFYLKESNLFYVGEWQHISQVFPGLSE